jgi:hypothetical protein
MRAEINEMVTKKQYEESKCQFFKETNKIDKPLTKLTKRRMEKI